MDDQKLVDAKEVRGIELARTLSETLIPKLEHELKIITTRAKSFGLVVPRGENGINNIDKKEILEKAREVIGGEQYIRDKQNVERLDTLDKNSERVLDDYERRLESGKLVLSDQTRATYARILKDFDSTRAAYNEAATRLNEKTKWLDSGDGRAAVDAKVAELSLLSEQANKVGGKLFERQARLEKTLSEARRLEHTYRAIGERTVKVTDKILDSGERLPVPANEKAVKDLLLSQKTKELSR